MGYDKCARSYRVGVISENGIDFQGFSKNLNSDNRYLLFLKYINKKGKKIAAMKPPRWTFRRK